LLSDPRPTESIRRARVKDHSSLFLLPALGTLFQHPWRAEAISSAIFGAVPRAAPCGMRKFIRRARDREPSFLLIRELVVENHIQQRLMHPDAALVFDEAKLAKAVHKKADTRTSGADHFRQRFLSDRGDQRFRLTRLAKFSHEQEDARQPLFAGVEELIDQIRLGPHASGQQKF